MRLTHTLFYLCMLFLLSACGGPDRKARAEAICGCLHALEELNLKLTDTITSGEEEAVTDLLLEITRMAGAARSCLQEQGVADGEALRRDAALTALLDQQCPHWAGILESLPLE